MSDVLVIIPTYNEIENISNIIDAVLALPDGFDILVIDDASPDGTQNAVRKKIEQYPGRVNMECRTGKLGLGTAYIHGFKWALSRGYQHMIEMDADFSHNPDDLPRLYHACKDNGTDMAIGSRYVSGVNVVNWPMGRVLMSYLPYQRKLLLFNMLPSFSCITPNTASPKIEEFIFDVPSCLLTNTMGTSTILNFLK